MNKILELRNKRNTLWEQTKNFLEEHRDENGLVPASALEQYEKMTADVQALGDEIKRLEDQKAIDAQLALPLSAAMGMVRVPLLVRMMWARVRKMLFSSSPWIS